MTWTPEFKRGDRVIVTKTYSDVKLGQTGVIKRVSEGYPQEVRGKTFANYVVCLDDGTGWTDYQEGGLGWHIEDSILALDKEYQLFEMDA